ncbi:DUF4760 domain-containing protein [Lelliottia amnigena]|uniref:DUF4760 domain-containing protein n=1 Tax=Lelliottia amnigena TaxID=61646 RepID=UPI001ED948E7|nr:DUF4760 domain-containing protein [Lelliottia amnigena]
MDKITGLIVTNPPLCELSAVDRLVTALEKMITAFGESPTFYPAAFGVFVAVYSILTQRKTSREKNSLDFEISYKRSDNVNEAFTKLRPIVQKKFETPLAHWGKLENAGTDEAKALRTIFNEWERCANAVRNNIYDNDYLYKVYGSTVLNLDETFGEYIAECWLWNDRVYRNFKWLALRWKIKRCKEDLKPTSREHVKTIKDVEKLLKKLESTL